LVIVRVGNEMNLDALLGAAHCGTRAHQHRLREAGREELLFVTSVDSIVALARFE